MLMYHAFICFSEELWLARKDADRYLSTAFYHLTRGLDPDVIILLGDVFSDGFQASDNHWKDYLNVGILYKWKFSRDLYFKNFSGTGSICEI